MTSQTPDDSKLISVGGPVSRSSVSLRISGTHLDPDEITHLLKCKPTKSQRLGDILTSETTGKQRIIKEGMWRLIAQDRTPAYLDGQIREILEQLPNNLEVWKDLAARFKIDMFCGLFMDRTNEGLGFSPDTLFELGKRGIELGLDIYGPTFDDDLEVQIAKARSRPAKLSH